MIISGETGAGLVLSVLEYVTQGGGDEGSDDGY